MTQTPHPSGFGARRASRDGWRPPCIARWLSGKSVTGRRHGGRRCSGAMFRCGGEPGRWSGPGDCCLVAVEFEQVLGGVE
jgi:hypothetical protein